MLSGLVPAVHIGTDTRGIRRRGLAIGLAAAAVLALILGLGFRLVRDIPSAGTANQVVADSTLEAPAVAEQPAPIEALPAAPVAVQQPDPIDETSVDHASSGSASTVTNLQIDSAGKEMALAPMNSRDPGLSMDGLDAPLALVDGAGEEQRLAIESLTRQAQTHQIAREFNDACRIYEQLTVAYPDSAAARDSHVALGQMKLAALKQPAEALVHFDAYLARSPSSFLAEEARVGRVRSLDRLDRNAEVVNAATEFMDTHPGGSAYPEVLRLRGDAHLHNGELLLAATDYNEVIERWPGTAQAQWASNGLVACQP